MKLSIAGVLYDPASLDRLTLREILTLEKATADLGRPLKWPEIKAMAEDAAADPEGFEDSPDMLWTIALMVYASRLRAGEDITFADAIDFEMGQIDWILEPGDEEAVSGPKALTSRPVSARAASRRAPEDRKKKSAPKSSRA